MTLEENSQDHVEGKVWKEKTMWKETIVWKVWKEKIATPLTSLSFSAACSRLALFLFLQILTPTTVRATATAPTTAITTDQNQNTLLS